MERPAAASLLRSTQALCGQLCEKETLTHGIAYYCARYATLSEVNQFREVVADEEATVSEAWGQAGKWFRQQKLACHRWAPAGDAPPPALEAYLGKQGFRRVEYDVMVLSRWPAIDVGGCTRVLPARAMREAYRSTFLSAESQANTDRSDDLADLYAERLDDPQFDAFVALNDKKPIGRCTLFQVGDIARVMDLHVMPGSGDRDVALVLLGHILALARRLVPRTVCAQVAISDPLGQSSFESAGFTRDGTIIEFERDPARERDPAQSIEDGPVRPVTPS